MTDGKESAADRAIREALESVERHERDAKKQVEDVKAQVDATDEEADQVQILGADDMPPAGAEPPKPAAPKKSASDMLLEVTLKAKAEMQDVLTQTQKEAKDLFDRLTRVSADFDNFKKRMNREKADAIKFANEGVMKEMLPVLDNMSRALSSGTDADKLLDGVKLVAKQFEDVMAKLGAVSFQSQGLTFDPARHEAVGSRPDPIVPAQHVCEEFQRGYMLHDRLLRPALVIVSSGPPATEN